MVTKKEIAEYLGISRTAVSLVLNNTPSGTISEKTRNKIVQAAKELGYRDSVVSPQICYVLYDRVANDPRYLTDLQIIEAAASSHDYGLVFINITREPESIGKLQKSIASKEIDGYIITGDVDENLCELFRNSNIPYVFYGMPLSNQENLNFISFDFERLAYNAVHYLISIDHSRIALFIGSLDYNIHQQILDGYLKAHEDNDIPIDKSLIQISNEENGYELGRRADMLRLKYTGAFCANTVIQFGVLQYLQGVGISVPGDISLVGSGLTELAKISVPQLTTYYVNSVDKELTVPLLLEVIKNYNSKEPFTVRVTEFQRFEGGTVAAWKGKENN